MTSSIANYFAKSKRTRSSVSSGSEQETPKRALHDRKKLSTTVNPPMERDSFETNEGMEEALVNINKRLDALATRSDIDSLKIEVQHLTETFIERFEKLEGRLLETEARNDCMEKEIRDLREEKGKLRNAINAQERRIAMLQKDQNNFQQYSRRWNLRIYKVPEKEGETAADCGKKCSKIFSEQMQINIKEADIEIAHRTGMQNRDKPRPILVRFFDRKKRDTVLENRKRLKGKAVSIGEDLTYENYKLYTEAQKHSATISVWTSNGVVKAKLKNGKTLKLDIHTNIEQAFKRVMEEPDSEEQVCKDFTITSQEAVLPVFFKFKVTHPDDLFFSPKTGCIAPGKTVSVRVKYRPSSDIVGKIVKVIVQTLKSHKDITVNVLPNSVWSKAPAKSLREDPVKMKFCAPSYGKQNQEK